MSQRPVKLGLCLPLFEDPQSGRVTHWDEIRASAVAAEQMGLDTVWIPDELLWRNPEWPGPRGWWECVATAGAVAACTRRIAVGTWVMSNLYRNPTLTAKIVETLDEISGGRHVFGIGAGSGGGGEADAFGYRRDHAYSRFAEALDVLLPLLKTGRVEHQGAYYQATDLELRPRGPRPGGIPLVIGAMSPKMIRLAARHADIWTGFATEDSHASAFGDLLGEVSRACEEVGRDPRSLGRSVGVFVEPTEASGTAASGLGEPLRGPAQRIAEGIAEFAAAGVTQVEMWPMPFSLAAVEALAPIVAALDQAAV